MKRAPLTITVVAVAAIVLLALTGCQGGQKKDHAAAGAPIAVRVVAAAPAAVAEQVEVTGSLHGAREAVCRPRSWAPSPPSARLPVRLCVAARS
jgi:multidrug efflux pump subunit AcrA (membrane-fusion protein)